jgi:SAM-dependent methyltransferase
MDRALSFGSDAEAYDRHRPDYPVAIVGLAIAHAQGPVRRALEVGAGTGKATVVFAGRGIDVVAVEPDPGMREVLEARVRVAGLRVEIVPATFEDVDLDAVGHVDLLFAAAAFHWTDPATRWERVAAAVRPGGAVAVFGIARDLADEALRERVDALTAYATGGPFDLSWTIDDLRARPDLTDVVETRIPRSVTMSADDYVAHLSTVSAYRVLPAAEGADLLARVRAALPDNVEVSEDVTGHLARRTDHHEGT